MIQGRCDWTAAASMIRFLLFHQLLANLSSCHILMTRKAIENYCLRRDIFLDMIRTVFVSRGAADVFVHNTKGDALFKPKAVCSAFGKGSKNAISM